MNKILNQQELDEMEIRIYQTYGMGKFSPKDVMDLIYTAQKYMQLTKEFQSLIKPIEITQELANHIKNKNDYDILQSYVDNCRNMESPMGDIMARNLIKILNNGFIVKEEI